MYSLYILFIVLCALLSVLTSDALKKDEMALKLVESFSNFSSSSSKKKFDSNDSLSFISEGGGGNVKLAAEPLKLKNLPELATFKELSSPPRLSIGSNETEHVVSPRKEAIPPTPKIKPRKGVGTPEIENIPARNASTLSLVNSTLETSTLKNRISELDMRNFPKSELNIPSSIPAKTLILTENLPINQTRKSKKYKLKPAVTFGGSNVNKPISISSKKSQSSGTPKKIDLIVPIVITILVLPILGIATHVLYRRGKDCWDKRHYRRMDFLIDGMYND